MLFIAPLKALFCGLGRAFSALIKGFSSVEIPFFSWSLYVSTPGALKQKIILLTARSVTSSRLLLGQPLEPRCELLCRAVRRDSLTRAELPLLTRSEGRGSGCAALLPKAAARLVPGRGQSPVLQRK